MIHYNQQVLELEKYMVDGGSSCLNNKNLCSINNSKISPFKSA